MFLPVPKELGNFNQIGKLFCNQNYWKPGTNLNITSNFKNNYRQTPFFTVIDKVLAEYENRFTSNLKFLSNMAVFDVNDEKLLDLDLIKNIIIEKFICHYTNIITKELNETLKAEINTAKIYLHTVEIVCTIVDVHQHLNALKS